MPNIYLGQNAYKRGDNIMPDIICRNQFMEAAPSSQTGGILLARPALEAWATVGSGPSRAVYRQAGVASGNFIAVSGGTAYKVTTAGVPTSIGAVSGSDRVDIAGSGAYLVIANGTGGYSYDGATYTPIVFPDSAGISTVDYMDGYFLLGRTGSQRFYWTGINTVTVDPLDYASAERTPDLLVAIRVITDEVWLFGETSIEIWVPTGQAELPFERVNGRVFQRGCINRDTVARLDNTLFWVGDDRIVYRGGDSSPTAISSNSIDERIRRADKTKLRGWSFTWDGHVFYCLTIDTQGTFCYDVTTGQWCEFASYGRHSWRAHVGAYTESLIIAGDDETGQLWKLSNDVFLDGTDPIVMEATALLPINAIRVKCLNLSLDISVGNSTVPEEAFVEMRYSDDVGRTWTSWDKGSLGKTGEYNTRVVWRALGQMSSPGRSFHIRMSSPSPYRLTRAIVNELFP